MTPAAEKTTAERVADRFEDDDAPRPLQGDRLETLCFDADARRETRDGFVGCRFLFEDGSAIVLSRSSWGIEGAEPFSWRR